MTNTTNIESMDHGLGLTKEWLTELRQDLVVADDVAYAALRSVLHALRDRLPLIAGVRLGAQLPTVLRGVYYEGWQPDRGHVHTRTLGEFLTLVERDAPHGSELSAEDKSRAVLRLLSSRLDPAEIARLLIALPPPVQALFADAYGNDASADSKRASARFAPAKTA